MKKILIPTDFSDNAWDALTYALRLYDDIPCSFYILNTFEVGATGAEATLYTGATKKLYNILKDDSKQGLEKIENYLNEYLLNDKHEYNIHSKHGPLLSVTKDLIAKQQIDLIVMGTKGASGMKGILMGSNTTSLIKNIKDCPILAVPEKFEFREPEKLSLATDLNELLSSDLLNPLRELLLIHNLDLELLHVKNETILSVNQEENKKLIEQLFSHAQVIYREVSFDKSIANSINQYTTNNAIDILCMIQHKHSFIERLTREPVIKKVGFNTNVPLLIISD